MANIPAHHQPKKFIIVNRKDGTITTGIAGNLQGVAARAARQAQMVADHLSAGQWGRGRTRCPRFGGNVLAEYLRQYG